MSGIDLLIHHSDFPSGIRLCVGAVVLRGEKVLFVRQTYGKLRGTWSLPWGLVDGMGADGHPEPPDEAAMRETEEEGGIAARVEGLLGIQNHSTEEGQLGLYILYLCSHVSGEPTPDNHETDRAAYFSLDELASFDEFCEWIARRVLTNEHHVTPPTSTTPYHPHLAFLKGRRLMMENSGVNQLPAKLGVGSGRHENRDTR